jgi:hypothetical protein
MKRTGRTLTVFALLALAVLLFRPAALDALGLLFGSYHSEVVTLVKAEGSHCELIADCETVSIANIGLADASGYLPLALAGLVIVVTLVRRRGPAGWAPLVPDPPPLSSFR